jgi:hypothetical protein
MPGVAFPPVGPVGLSSPPSQVLCSAQTALARLRTLRLSLAPPYLACFCAFVVSLWGSWSGRNPQTTPGPWVTRSPHLGVWQGDTWLSHVPELPLWRRPALRPRWCPERSPSRLQDCCLPATGNRRLSPHTTWRDILLSTTIPISGLNHAACLLASSSSVRPLLGVHVDVTSDLLARL